MTVKVFPLLPRRRTDRERVADVLGRKWLTVIERGALDGDTESRPKWIEELTQEAIRRAGS